MNNDPNNKDEMNFLENSSSNDIENREISMETPESNRNNSVFPEVPQNDINTAENLGVELNQNKSVPVEPVNEMKEKPVVDMPRTVLETSANPNTLTTPEKKPDQAVKTDNSQSSSTIPVIFFFIMICIGGYFAFNYFNPNNKPLPYYENNETENNKTEEKEETKEDKEKTEATENTNTEEKTNQETKDNAKEAAPTETPSAPITPPATTPSTTTPEPTTSTTDNNTSSDSEIELTPGMTIYLYEDESIGVDGVTFSYISHTPSQIVVDVEINNNIERYTITPGKATKIKGLKNNVVLKINEENIGIKFQ